MYNEDLNELYHVCWRPQSTTTHSLTDPLSAPAPHASALQYLGTVKTPSKPAGAYRPPGARGQITPLAFRREDEGGAAYVRDGTSSFSSNINGFGPGKSRRREIPGAEPSESLPPGAAPGGGVSLTPGAAPDGDAGLSKSATKNKKKREAKKAKEQAEKSDTLAPELSAPGNKTPSRSPERRGGGRGHERSRSKGSHGYTTAPGPDGSHQPRQYRDRSRSTNRDRRPRHDTHGHIGAPIPQSAKIVSTPQPNKPSINTSLPPPPPPSGTPELQVTSPTTPGSGGGSAQDKKVRGLLKKIRAIDDLKMRLAGGEKLEDTQMKKIKTEEAVRRELQAIEPDA